jgi:hypothetical protein
MYLMDLYQQRQQIKQITYTFHPELYEPSRKQKELLKKKAKDLGVVHLWKAPSELKVL